MSRPRLFAELPAGLAAVSLRLHGGAKCKPPISRMGSKSGFGEIILATLGLRSGQGADRYLWAEADQDVAALLRCYPDADMLKRVAEIIRGWKDEEPRALWERLRAERKARGARTDAEGTAGWMFTAGASWKGQGAHYRDCSTSGGGDNPLTPGGLGDACHRLAEYATIVSSNRLINMAGPDMMNTGNGGTRYGGEFATPVGEVAERFEGMAREVAAWFPESDWAYRQGTPDSGFNPSVASGVAYNAGPATWDRRCIALASQGWPPVVVLPRIPEAAEVAEWMGTPGDLEGCVIYADPPYLDTTGYSHNLPREEVVRYALAFAELGATVAISEQEALPELMALGWHAARITEGRKGQRRTFSKQVEEYVTMNRAPAHVVSCQVSMFAA